MNWFSMMFRKMRLYQKVKKEEGPIYWVDQDAFSSNSLGIRHYTLWEIEHNGRGITYIKVRLTKVDD